MNAAASSWITSSLASALSSCFRRYSITAFSFGTKNSPVLTRTPWRVNPLPAAGLPAGFGGQHLIPSLSASGAAALRPALCVVAARAFSSFSALIVMAEFFGLALITGDNASYRRFPCSNSA